jgi:hypothetical protein
MVDETSSSEARLLILETSVAALIAQLPPGPLEQVVGMLTHISATSAALDELAGAHGAEQLGQLRYWAEQMISRVLTSSGWGQDCGCKSAPERDTDRPCNVSNDNKEMGFKLEPLGTGPFHH